MIARNLFALCAAEVLVAGCGGGSIGAAGDFSLIEFLDSGKNEIPRNRPMEFRFSRAIATDQDLFERLRIQDIQADGAGQSNFAKANGTYCPDSEVRVHPPATKSCWTGCVREVSV